MALPTPSPKYMYAEIRNVKIQDRRKPFPDCTPLFEADPSQMVVAVHYSVMLRKVRAPKRARPRAKGRPRGV